MIRRFLWNWIGAMALIVSVAGVQQMWGWQETQSTQETTGQKKSKKKKKLEDESMSNSANRAQQAPESTAGQATKTEKQAGAATRMAPHPVQNATEAEIAAAKAEGKVWVNTETGVFHKSGKWYGTTKKGKFMTEGDALKAGYRASKQ